MKKEPKFLQKEQRGQECRNYGVKIPTHSVFSVKKYEKRAKVPTKRAKRPRV
jgi:hypothetical protein